MCNCNNCPYLYVMDSAKIVRLTIFLDAIISDKEQLFAR